MTDKPKEKPRRLNISAQEGLEERISEWRKSRNGKPPSLSEAVRLLVVRGLNEDGF